jgi:hypothetical protein
MGECPQEIINRLVIKSDILVAIFWSRLGSPTGVAASGTIEEIEKHRGSKKPTMIYFSNAPVPHDVDTKQFEDVRKLQQKYESEGLIGTFRDSEDFRRIFTHDFTANSCDFTRRNPVRVHFALLCFTVTDERSRRSGVESRSGCGWSKNDGVRTPGHVRS